MKAFPAETVTKLTDRIRFVQVGVARQEIILIHVDTNHVADPLSCSGSARAKTPQQLLRKYKVLRDVIRRWKSRALILFSSILLMLKQYSRFKPYMLGLNFTLEEWCARSGGSYLIIQGLPSRRRAKGGTLC